MSVPDNLEKSRPVLVLESRRKALIDWLAVGRSQGEVRWWQPFAWLVYPAVYLLLALLILNHAGRRAPYYFLDPQSVGMFGVAANVGVTAGSIKTSFIGSSFRCSAFKA